MATSPASNCTFPNQGRRRLMRKLALASVVVVLAMVNAQSAFPQGDNAPNNSASNSSNNSEDTTIHSQVDVVSVYFTVRDDKKHLAGELTRDHFHVFEDGKEQPIKF